MPCFLTVLHREFIYIWYYFEIQFRQICRYWILGMLIGSLISVFAKDRIHGIFAGMRNKKLGLLGVIPACILGIISPLCMYGTIPIAASFRKQGMREDWLASFMMASILLNPQLIIYSAALGKNALIIRIISCFLCGCAAGLLVFLFYRNRDFFDFNGFEERASRDTHPNPLVRYLLNVWRNIKATGLYFLFGILLSALFQRYVPPGPHDKSLRRQRCLGCPDGGNDRRPPLCLRRRNHPASAGMADERHEHGQHGSLYDHRPGHQDY
jgi:uncharacterized membrane protein YraQ (UPF0718 family)